MRGVKPIIFLAAATALALATPAAAKEGGAAYEVCGPDACASIGHGSDSVVVLDSGSESPPPPPGPYYRIDYNEQHAVPYYFRPDRRLVGAKLGTNGEISWYRIDGTSALQRLNAATAKLEPYGVGSTSGDGRNLTPWIVAAVLLLLLCLGAALLLKGAPMKRLVAHFLLVLVAALALASTAAAKELTTAQACGLDGQCEAMDKDGSMLILSSGGSVSQPPPTTAEYYRVDYVFDSPDGREHHSFSHLFVPSTGLVGMGDEVGGVAWFPVYGQALDTLREATRDLEPFSAPAAWPTSIEDPIFTPGRVVSPAPDSGIDWRPWALAAGLVLLALAAGAFLARRLRVRRPTTA
jgi:hypothetical protein